MVSDLVEAFKTADFATDHIVEAHDVVISHYTPSSLPQKCATEPKRPPAPGNGKSSTTKPPLPKKPFRS